jgi:hypothetical protein
MDRIYLAQDTARCTIILDPQEGFCLFDFALCSLVWLWVCKLQSNSPLFLIEES